MSPLIPGDKHPAIMRALRETFNVAEPDDITQMTKGLSSDLVFRIAVNGAPYLLRVITRINEQTDPGRHFTCMKAAAEAGVAPAVRYVNAEDGIAITDFVDAKPFSRKQALTLVPALLRKLHAIAPFPKTFNYVTAHNGFIWRFRTANLLPESEVAEAFSRYEQICAVYPRTDSDIVSCHSDLKPENMLFDGERLWLVDWQAAFLNDRYFDLAVAANFVVESEADEAMYLQHYFGRPADDYERARFFLMRQVTHMFYAAVFLLLGAGGTPVDLSESVPSFDTFHERVWAGEINLANAAPRVTYGRVHWDVLAQNIRGLRFAEALRIVRERNGNDGYLLLPRQPANHSN